MIVKKVISTKLPAKLDPETKKTIKRSYLDAVDNMGEPEFEYIAKRIDTKFKATLNAATAWIVDMASYYKDLCMVIISHDENKEKISKMGYYLIAAALFYFVNPFDIIPDYIPGIGYVDDMFVLITCLRSLKAHDREVVAKYLTSIF